MPLLQSFISTAWALASVTGITPRLPFKKVSLHTPPVGLPRHWLQSLLILKQLLHFSFQICQYIMSVAASKNAPRNAPSILGATLISRRSIRSMIERGRTGANTNIAAATHNCFSRSRAHAPHDSRCRRCHLINFSSLSLDYYIEMIAYISRAIIYFDFNDTRPDIICLVFRAERLLLLLHIALI